MSIQGDAAVVGAANEILRLIRGKKADYKGHPDAISALEDIEKIVKQIKESAEAGW